MKKANMPQNFAFTQNISTADIASWAERRVARHYARFLLYTVAQLKNAKRVDYTNMLNKSWPGVPYNYAAFQIAEKYDGNPIEFILDRLRINFEWAITTNPAENRPNAFVKGVESDLTVKLPPFITRQRVDAFFDANNADDRYYYDDNDFLLHYAFDNTVVKFWEWPYVQFSRDGRIYYNNEGHPVISPPQYPPDIDIGTDTLYDGIGDMVLINPVIRDGARHEPIDRSETETDDVSRHWQEETPNVIRPDNRTFINAFIEDFTQFFQNILTYLKGGFNA
jgi:hypothetical protein